VSALVGYQLATLVRSQRWVGPLVAYLCFLAFLYASSAGPAVPAFGVSAYALLASSAWLTTATLGAENEVARQVTVATAGSRVRVQLAALLAAAAAGAALAVVAVGWAMVADAAYASGGKAVLGGLGLHMVYALAGTALGALLGRPMVSAPGQAALGILAVLMLALILPGSPVRAALRVLENDPGQGFARALAPSLLGILALSAAGVAVSLAAAQRG
jgi:hypothetical protein